MGNNYSMPGERISQVGIRIDTPSNILSSEELAELSATSMDLLAKTDRGELSPSYQPQN